MHLAKNNISENLSDSMSLEEEGYLSGTQSVPVDGKQFY